MFDLAFDALGGIRYRRSSTVKAPAAPALQPGNRLMRWWIRSLVFVLAANLSGCAANDQARLTKEVDGLIRPGMSLSIAEKALRDAGFACDAMIGGRTCSRSKAYAVIATCMQRVNLTPDAAGSTLARFQVPVIPCASL
jgi:hypothetical protein